jgi:hypothetical protein
MKVKMLVANMSLSFSPLFTIRINLLAVPGHALLWLTRLNGKERKEKAVCIY